MTCGTEIFSLTHYLDMAQVKLSSVQETRNNDVYMKISNSKFCLHLVLLLSN